MKVHIIHPDGSVVHADWADPPLLPNLNRALREIVGGNIEIATVLFEDRIVSLAVNEVGAARDPAINPGGLLPPNARASGIYWTASIVGRTPVRWSPLAAPMIHGVAVLLECDKRDL